MIGSTLRRRLALTFVALAALTTIGIVLSAGAAVRLYTTQSTVTDDLFEAYSSAAALNQALLDQETGFRGFVLTGQDRFLAPYRAGVAQEERVQRRLERIEGEFPALRDRRMLIEDRAQRWRDTMAEPGVARTRAGDELSEAELVGGKQAFDGVRAAVNDYRDQILGLRSAKVRELDRASLVLFGVIAAGVLTLAVVAGLTWLALRRWVTDPLVRLGAEVDLVEEGDLSHQVAMEEAPAEIRELAGQVDRMRQRILREYAVAEQSRREALDARQVVEAQSDELLRSNAELEQFAYVASHDLQEPLRKVASFCQLIERRYKGQLDERGEQYIEFAVDGAKRMQRLINDLLAFSRVGRVSSEFAEVDLDVVLAQSLRQLETTITESGAEVTSDPLPHITGDASLLVQLFQNLVGNAVKFRGSDPPKVHIGVRRDGSMWEFSSADNGIGVEPEYAEKIFVIFQRLHGRESYGGTGIGLSMCKKIVEYHGGRMWLDTSAAGGATFRWTLPSDEERNPTDGSSAARPAGRGAVGGGRPG